MSIGCYLRKSGKDKVLLGLMKPRLPRSCADRLVADGPFFFGAALGGAFDEVSHRKWQEAIDGVVLSPAIISMQGEFGAVCDFVKIADKSESKQVSLLFAPIELAR